MAAQPDTQIRPRGNLRVFAFKGMSELSEPTVGEQKKPWLFAPGQSGNIAGRPKGSRNKLGEAFIAALHEDFQQNGVAAIEEVRQTKPDAYLKVIAAVIPKELNIKSDAFDGISDDLLAAVIVAARAALGIADDGDGDAGEATH